MEPGRGLIFQKKKQRLVPGRIVSSHSTETNKMGLKIDQDVLECGMKTGNFSNDTNIDSPGLRISNPITK